MNLTTPSVEQVKEFAAGCLAITKAYATQNQFTMQMGDNPQCEVRMEVSFGKRYARIARAEYWLENYVRNTKPTARSSHVFIDMTNGDVLKSAGWSTPAKGARGNLFDSSKGLSRMGPYGAGYNR